MFEERIFSVNDKNFEQLAIEIFHYQARNNDVYKQYIDYLHKDVRKISKIEQIPFLPIEFFKNQRVVCPATLLTDKEQFMFMSSGTTGQIRSKHYIYNINVYEKSFLNGFKKFFGNPENYVILALLPSYLEAGNSSLVYMVKNLIKISDNKQSGFFLNNYEQLADILTQCHDNKQQVVLFGVTYALLQMKFHLKCHLPNLKIIETGGMKGRGRELTRLELHEELQDIFGTKHIHSEYGMTELLSQAYSIQNGVFEPADTMQVLIRDINDPFAYIEDHRVGGINVIDLSNIYSCSFIETKDLGKKNGKKFEILGRFDNSDIRGCNLLVIS